MIRVGGFPWGFQRLKKISVRAYSFIAVLIVVAIAMIADHRITASYNQAVLEDVQINLSEIEALLKNEYASYRDDILFLYSTPPISGLTCPMAESPDLYISQFCGE